MWDWLSYHNKELEEFLVDKTKKRQKHFHVRILCRKITEFNAESKSAKNTIFGYKGDKIIHAYFFPQNSGVLDLKLDFKEAIIKGECIFHVCGYYYELSLGRHHEDIKGKNKIEDGLANP